MRHSQSAVAILSTSSILYLLTPLLQFSITLLNLGFLSRVSTAMLMRDIYIAIMSVRPSVRPSIRPSHFGTVSKRLKILSLAYGRPIIIVFLTCK